MKKDLILFFDCGDTLIDESTQVMDDEGNVLQAEAIGDAVNVMLGLYKEGYRIALVADGRVRSFRNILCGLGIDHIFEKWIISEEVGVEKPNALMFSTAMAEMNLRDKDKSRIVMVGNNIKRDILGANEMGITSILVSFTPRYSMKAETPEETPDYVVALPDELPQLVDLLNRQVQNRNILG